MLAYTCSGLFSGARMFSGRAEESTKKTSESFQRQKVRLYKCLLMKQYNCTVGGNTFACFAASFWTDFFNMSE